MCHCLHQIIVNCVSTQPKVGYWNLPTAERRRWWEKWEGAQMVQLWFQITRPPQRWISWPEAFSDIAISAYALGDKSQCAFKLQTLQVSFRIQNRKTMLVLCSFSLCLSHLYRFVPLNIGGLKGAWENKVCHYSIQALGIFVVIFIFISPQCCPEASKTYLSQVFEA